VIRSVLVAVAAVPALLLAAGCGGSAPEPVKTQLEQHFQQGLDQLAEMDANEDSGFDAKRGRLTKATCSPSSCTLRWRTWDGKVASTRYVIRGNSKCFTAHAKPELPAVMDDTIGAYGAHPLNDMSSKPGLDC
jgi:hypothetical protein